MPRLLTTLGCLLALCTQPSSAEEIAVPHLPEGTTVHSSGWCPDPVTKARLICFVYKDGTHTYTVYREPNSAEVQRMTWSEGFNQPETIWVRHGDDTF